MKPLVSIKQKRVVKPKPPEDVLKLLPKDRPTRVSEPEVTDPDLPGANLYDKAVKRGFTYAAAKQREEVRLLDEKIKQAKIDTETASLTLESRKLEVAQERGNLVTKEEYIERQEIMVSTFLELLRLAVTDMAVRLPSTQREIANEEVMHKCNSALGALSKATIDRKPREVASQLMHDAFRGN